jgi:DNA mismatch repair protein MutS
MTGVPHHAVDRYCAILVEKGYAIAICDQMETAAEATAAGTGLVRREVVRVLTLGTIQEEEMLQARRNNFLAAIVIVGDNDPVHPPLLISEKIRYGWCATGLLD